MKSFAMKIVLTILVWLWWSVSNTGVTLRGAELKRVMTFLPCLVNMLTLGLYGVIHAVRLRTQRLRLYGA
tara:strand:- start:628 stop:837 length:210 start_codon:yes stop_codon:yes gene_type:complete